MSLPDILPIFPLPGVILLPRGRLPLNIFEPRYINMVDDALGQGRLIGIIQPAESESKNPVPSLYQVGCVGKIISFTETDDHRYLISLQGLSRFTAGQEMPIERGYRRVKPSFEKFAIDMEGEEKADINRERLFNSLRSFFRTHNIDANWETIQNTSDDTLVTSLTMICPFAASEKQALLEAATLAERARLLMALLDMTSLHKREAEGAARH
jgi:Lon protease-like protein